MTTVPSTQPDYDRLRQQLDEAQTRYVSAMMERNFLKQAMADLNFHQNAHDGIVFVDTEGRVVYTNPYFLEMMGIDDPAQVLNQPLPAYMFTHAQDALQLIEDVKQYGFVREREMHLLNRANQPVFAMCSSVLSKDDDGQPIGVEMMFCNVTSKRKIQAELVARKRELEHLHAFTSHSIETLIDMVKRGADRAELLTVLAELETRHTKLEQATTE